MKRLMQSSLFSLVAILVFVAPDAFAIDNCQRCNILQSGSYIAIFCDRPQSGEIGARYCFLEDDGNGSVYCHTEGDWCCVTGPAY
jgi:hypothetical protein